MAKIPKKSVKAWVEKKRNKLIQPFKSKFIPPNVLAATAEQLQDAESEADINAIFEMKSTASYRQDLRQNVRGLWTGQIDFVDFVDGMQSAIGREFRAAWRTAFEQLGLSFPDDMTPQEIAALDLAILRELQHVYSFGFDIEANNKESGAKLQPHLDRIERWVNRSNEITSKALTMAQSDPALKWIMDPRKENCSSCAKLNGKVKRASFWQQAGIIPALAGAPYLECKGYNCGCVLQAVNEPLSKGRLPGLP